jgi:hypothetical protein
MKTFIQFLEERSVDPVKLAQRVAQRYGKKTSYGKWLKTEKGKHIPLSTFNSKEANSVENKGEKVWNKLGGEKEYKNAQTKKTMNIGDLRATQPFARTDDVEKLKNKISNTEPDHIVVATHKGKHYILDGHHAVMAAKLRGEKTVSVKHINYDDQ